MSKTFSRVAPAGGAVSADEVRHLVTEACPANDYRGKRVLLIVPDGTRTAPIGLMFQSLHQQFGGVTQTFDVLIALGTHPPMTEEAICERLEISPVERRARFAQVRFFNHEWDN